MIGQVPLIAIVRVWFVAYNDGCKNVAWVGESMSSYTTAMTQRSQVTVPSAVRKVLGLKPRDRITFEVSGNQVTIRPAAPSLSSLAGSIPPFPGSTDRDIERYIEEANEDHADSVVAEMNR